MIRSVINRRELLKKYNVDAETEKEMARRNEEERLAEMLEAQENRTRGPDRYDGGWQQRNKKQRSRTPAAVRPDSDDDDDAKQPESTTTLITEDETSNSKKRKSTATTATRAVVVPAVPPRNATLAGGGKKPAGVVFCATYDDAAVLGKTLGKLEKFTSSYNMVFTDEGLEINFIDNSHVMMVRVTVPAHSFVQYVDLVQPFTHGVMAKEVKQFGDLCKKKHTLSYTRELCGIDDLPLGMRLMPADGRVTRHQEVREEFKPEKIDELVVAPKDPYQYKVRLPAKLFYENVHALARRSGTICLMLSKEAFEMIGVAETNMHHLSYHIPVSQCIEGKNDTDDRAAEQQAEEGDDEDDEEPECGVITRIGDRNSRITMAQFRNYRLSAVYLESAASFGNTNNCKYVVLRMGVTLRDDGSGLQDEEPLHMCFHMRAGAPQGAFDVDMWICAKANE